MALLELVLSLSVACAAGEEGAAAANARPALEHVAFVGASLTGGFGVALRAETDQGSIQARIDPARVLRVAGGIDAKQTSVHHDPMFFDHPTESGPRLLAQALEREPSLIVGLDFLFWYGYGTKNRDGRPIASEEERLILLGEGLALLEQVACPLVLGDFPDMAAAAGGMLPRTALPRPETLAALNDALRAWATGRANVIVLPLAELAAQRRADQGFAIGAWKWPAGCAGELVQKDQLHPSLDGLIVLAQLVIDRLAALGLVAPAAFRLEREELTGLLREDALRLARSGAQPADARELVPGGR
jgi:hypothetical protein